jgi:hypothetical protein
LKGKLIKWRSIAPFSAQKKIQELEISKKSESRCYCAASDLLLRKLGSGVGINQLELYWSL